MNMKPSDLGIEAIIDTIKMGLLYDSNEKKKHIESFKNSSREKRGKILKELLESRELKFHEISKLIKLNQKEMMYLLNKMREDKLIEINENKRIVILTKR